VGPFENRVFTQQAIVAGWSPFESRAPKQSSCCWEPLWKQGPYILQLMLGLVGGLLKVKHLHTGP